MVIWSPSQTDAFQWVLRYPPTETQQKLICLFRKFC